MPRKRSKVILATACVYIMVILQQDWVKTATACGCGCRRRQASSTTGGNGGGGGGADGAANGIPLPILLALLRAQRSDNESDDEEETSNRARDSPAESRRKSMLMAAAIETRSLPLALLSSDGGPKTRKLRKEPMVQRKDAGLALDYASGVATGLAMAGMNPFGSTLYNPMWAMMTGQYPIMSPLAYKQDDDDDEYEQRPRKRKTAPKSTTPEPTTTTTLPKPAPLRVHRVLDSNKDDNGDDDDDDDDETDDDSESNGEQLLIDEDSTMTHDRKRRVKADNQDEAPVEARDFVRPQKKYKGKKNKDSEWAPSRIRNSDRELFKLRASELASPVDREIDDSSAESENKHKKRADSSEASEPSENSRKRKPKSRVKLTEDDIRNDPKAPDDSSSIIDVVKANGGGISLVAVADTAAHPASTDPIENEKPLAMNNLKTVSRQPKQSNPAKKHASPPVAESISKKSKKKAAVKAARASKANKPAKSTGANKKVKQSRANGNQQRDDPTRLLLAETSPSGRNETQLKLFDLLNTSDLIDVAATSKSSKQEVSLNISHVLLKHLRKPMESTLIDSMAKPSFIQSIRLHLLSLQNLTNS